MKRTFFSSLIAVDNCSNDAFIFSIRVFPICCCFFVHLNFQFTRLEFYTYIFVSGPSNESIWIQANPSIGAKFNTQSQNEMNHQTSNGYWLLWILNIELNFDLCANCYLVNGFIFNRLVDTSVYTVVDSLKQQVYNM